MRNIIRSFLTIASALVILFPAHAATNMLQEEVKQRIAGKLHSVMRSQRPDVRMTATSRQEEETSDYDFCETNDDGIMLYYRYVEQDFCELAAGPEKYQGVVSVPPFVTERNIPVVGVGYGAFYECDNLTEVRLPYTTLYLESLSFPWCYKLQKVETGGNLIAIGQLAFYCCTELSSFDIPESMEYVGYEAFMSCFELTTPLYNSKYFFHYPDAKLFESKYEVPDGIEEIGEGAFIFTILDEVVLPNSVKTIADYAFDGSHISKVEIPPYVETIGDHAFGQMFQLKEIVVPASVKNFGELVFFACGLKKAVFENQLEAIPEGTFDCCGELEEVIYPSTVHKLGEGAFASCYSLTKLPDLSNIDTLESAVFFRCTGLESISLPSSITYLPDSAFYWCHNVKEVKLPESIENIGNFAFDKIEQLETIVIPSSVTEIGKYAFVFCKNLKNIVLQEGLESIGEGGLSQLNQLESITLPKSLKNIDEWGLSYDYNLKDIYVQWQEPLMLKDDIFDYYQYTLGITLHVPQGCKEAYENAPYWNQLNIVESGTGIDPTRADETPKRRYDVQGLKLQEPLVEGFSIEDGRLIYRR